MRPHGEEPIFPLLQAPLMHPRNGGKIKSVAANPVNRSTMGRVRPWISKRSRDSHPGVQIFFRVSPVNRRAVYRSRPVSSVNCALFASRGRVLLLSQKLDMRLT